MSGAAPAAPRPLRVAVGMSGGVDSSVAALLLARAGHRVEGIMMTLWPPGAPEPAPRPRKSACFGPGEDEDIETARAVCGAIGIPFRAIDCAAEYEAVVLRDFRDEFRRGRTPNPCVRCNSLVKFGILPDAARRAGIAFDRFATGHYARVAPDPRTGRVLLKAGLDERKDQSYFLYRLSQEQLAAAMFPLGDLRKDEVRTIARDAGLPVLDRRESQDFYAGDLKDILGAEERAGEIVDARGAVLGRHRGVWNYTVGQRKGLGIASSEPLYVVAIDAPSNRLVVGPESETFRTSCVVADCRWVAIERLDAPMTVAAKVRSNGRAHAAAIAPLPGGRARVDFEGPVAAVTPGQSAVFYLDDVVVGGGVIEKTG